MTATFLIEIEIDDPTALADEADDITEACDKAGFSVISVKPWARQQQIQPTPI